VLCIECGYHLERGEQLETRRKPFRREINLGLPRWLALVLTVIFLGVVVGGLVAGVQADVRGLRWLAAFGFVALFVLPFAAARLVIERSRKGDLLLRLFRDFFFVPLVWKKVHLRHYDRALTNYLGDSEDASFFSVTLCGPRAAPVRLYYGSDERKMKEVLDCLQFDVGLTIGRGDDRFDA
jgi:hypothetical protein